jgi:hypothetical protein
MLSGFMPRARSRPMRFPPPAATLLCYLWHPDSSKNCGITVTVYLISASRLAKPRKCVGAPEHEKGRPKAAPPITISNNFSVVIPAKAGIQSCIPGPRLPAFARTCFAGVTGSAQLRRIKLTPPSARRRGAWSRRPRSRCGAAFSPRALHARGRYSGGRSRQWHP